MEISVDYRRYTNLRLVIGYAALFVTEGRRRHASDAAEQEARNRK